MRRLAPLALLALALAVPGVSVATAAASRGDGGVPAGFDGGDSGGTPADWDGEGSGASSLAGDSTTTGGDEARTSLADELTAPTTGDSTTGSGGALAASAGGPTAVAAQESTPQQRPGNAGTQPSAVDTPAVPAGAASAAQAPAGGTGGSLPFTGLEVLQLMLLGIVLLLVGARLRALALRRRRASAEPTWGAADRAYEEDFARPIAAHRAEQRPTQRVPAHRAEPRPSRRAPQRDEWAFPDPDEPAPTGILPSTASARRRARMLAARRD
jgi:hypothetical protein